MFAPSYLCNEEQTSFTTSLLSLIIIAFMLLLLTATKNGHFLKKNLKHTHAQKNPNYVN